MAPESSITDADLNSELNTPRAVFDKWKSDALWLLRGALQEAIEPDRLAEVLKKYDAARVVVNERFNASPTVLTDAACSCMNDFIRAEFDYKTPGKRGLGRTTDSLPRFAAQHRKVCAQMDADGRGEWLPMHVKRHMVCGYLFHDFQFGCKERVEPGLSKSALWDMWIPALLSLWTDIQKGYREIESLSNPGELYYEATGGPLQANISSWMGDFEKFDEEVVHMYFFVGAGLRHLESMPLTKEQVLDISTGGAYSADKR